VACKLNVRRRYYDNRIVGNVPAAVIRTRVNAARRRRSREPYGGKYVFLYGRAYPKSRPHTAKYRTASAVVRKTPPNLTTIRPKRKFVNSPVSDRSFCFLETTERLITYRDNVETKTGRNYNNSTVKSVNGIGTFLGTARTGRENSIYIPPILRVVGRS